MAVTGERNEFGVHTPAYYERAYALLSAAGLARLFIATYEDRPIAGMMAFVCGHKSWYMYGASGDEHRDRMPNYALQWVALRWAKEQGCHTYDLYGVPDEDEGTLEAQFAGRSDGLWGVYRFKRGFGGQLVRSVGAYDAVYNAPLVWLYHQALRLRR
jgi:lipid II:glycine glycyltransferase (peptidoglycan interpeptide bridge formation enzyme)